MNKEAQTFVPESYDQEGPQPGPSWANPKWLSEAAEADADFASAMDPT